MSPFRLQFINGLIKMPNLTDEMHFYAIHSKN